MPDVEVDEHHRSGEPGDGVCYSVLQGAGTVLGMLDECGVDGGGNLGGTTARRGGRDGVIDMPHLSLNPWMGR
jgi:hypothetical protein